MGFAWIGWIDLTQEEYEQELAARKARLSRPGDWSAALTCCRNSERLTAFASLLFIAGAQDVRAQPRGVASVPEFSSDILFNSGQPVQPIFEGWTRNADGSYQFHFGYLNRNHVEEIHVPVGAGNSMQPDGPDHGQPT